MPLIVCSCPRLPSSVLPPVHVTLGITSVAAQLILQSDTPDSHDNNTFSNKLHFSWNLCVGFYCMANLVRVLSRVFVVW